MSLLATPCLLFVPGHRADRFDKARAASGGGIVIDLEDAVPPADKAAARAAAATWLRGVGPGAKALIRINPLDTRASLDDLTALADGTISPAGLVLAKVEDPRDIELVRALLPTSLALVATIETGRGVEVAAAIARALRPGDALAFGGADMAASLGAEFGWEPLFAARAALVLAAQGRLALFDVPHLDLKDTAALEAESRRVRAMGYTGKLAIHPAQVDPILDAFLPSADELAEARRVVDALDAAAGGVARLDGRMIDLPVALAARRVLARQKNSQRS